MTAYIDNIIIQGTPEEIQEFIELRKGEGVTVPGGWTIQSDVRYKLCPICYSAPCRCTTTIDIGTPDGYFSIRESGKPNF